VLGEILYVCVRVPWNVAQCIVLCPALFNNLFNEKTNKSNAPSITLEFIPGSPGQGIHLDCGSIDRFIYWWSRFGNKLIWVNLSYV